MTGMASCYVTAWVLPAQHENLTLTIQVGPLLAVHNISISSDHLIDPSIGLSLYRLCHSSTRRLQH